MGMLVNSFIAFGGAAPPAGPYNFPIMAANNGAIGTINPTQTALMSSTDTPYPTIPAYATSVTPVDIDLANFKFVLGTAPGSSVTRTISIFDDGSTSGLDVAITGASVDGIDTGSATIAAQSAIYINNADDGAPANSTLTRWRADCTSDNQVLMAHSGGLFSTGTNSYLPLLGTAGSGSSTEADAYQVIPIAGNIKNMIARNNSTAIASGSWAITLIVNGSATALTCTLDSSGAIATDAVHSVAVVAGDKVSWLCDPTSPNATKALAVGCEFECSVAGTGIIMGGSSAAPSNTVAQYGWQGSGGTANCAWAGESDVQALAQAITVTDLYVIQSVACGAAKTRTTLLRDDAAGTSASVAITGAAAVTGSWNGSVSVAVDSLICIETTPDGTPAASTVKWGLAYHT